MLLAILVASAAWLGTALWDTAALEEADGGDWALSLPVLAAAGAVVTAVVGGPALLNGITSDLLQVISVEVGGGQELKKGGRGEGGGGGRARGGGHPWGLVLGTLPAYDRIPPPSRTPPPPSFPPFPPPPFSRWDDANGEGSRARRW